CSRSHHAISMELGGNNSCVLGNFCFWRISKTELQKSTILKFEIASETISDPLKIFNKCSTNIGLYRQTVISSGLHHPFDLAVFDHRLFWTDWEAKAVMVADMRNITGTQRVLKVVRDTLPFGITIAHPAYHNPRKPVPSTQC